MDQNAKNELGGIDLPDNRITRHEVVEIVTECLYLMVNLHGSLVEQFRTRWK